MQIVTEVLPDPIFLKSKLCKNMLQNFSKYQQMMQILHKKFKEIAWNEPRILKNYANLCMMYKTVGTDCYTPGDHTWTLANEDGLFSSSLTQSGTPQGHDRRSILSFPRHNS